MSTASRSGADELIARLGLEPLPREGGFFRQTHLDETRVTVRRASDGDPVERALSTCIYYLLTPGARSALHRLPWIEIFHFYLGDPVEMLQLLPDGTSARITLGHDLSAGHRVQVVVPAGTC